MQTHQKLLLIAALLFSCIGCDQVTKFYAVNDKPLMTTVTYLGGILQFQFAENAGYFLSMGSALPFKIRRSIQSAMAISLFLGLIALIIYARKISSYHIIAYSLFLAGAISNLIDRIFHYGHVIDFIVFGTDSIRTGIFNIADVCITIGIVMFFLLELVHKRIEYENDEPK